MIYLDNAATTIMREEVLAAMLPYMREQFANPAAAYRSAKAVRDSVEHARFQCASLINASASAHKLGGPKGVGLLYVRPGLKLPPLLFGGAQEKGLRAGTTNTAGIIGFGMAAELAKRDMAKNTEKVSALRNRLIERVLTENPGAKLNGHPANRLPGNASFTFEDINGEELLMLLDAAGICASTGSACSAGNGEPSCTSCNGTDSRRGTGVSQAYSVGRYNIRGNRTNSRYAF